MPDERKAPKRAREGREMTETATAAIELRDKLDEFATLSARDSAPYRNLDQLIKQRAQVERRFGRVLAVLLHYAEMHIESDVYLTRTPQLVAALKLAGEMYAEHGPLHPDCVKAVQELRAQLFPEAKGGDGR